MKKQNILICIDRDGTIIYDKKYHLGSKKNWKSQLRILPSVIQGLKLLNNSLPRAKIHMITNQPGVAVKELPLLTKKRAEQICQEIIKRLKIKHAVINGYEVCGNASEEYQNKKKGIFTFEKKYICECECIKPKPGMVLTSLKKESFSKKNTAIYVIGDRASDVQTAHNASSDAIGILIPFINTPGEKKKLKQNKNTHTSRDFLEAVKFIIKREK